jgi:large subunit ribosomal protein L30
MPKKLRVEYTKSEIGYPRDQRETLRSLGLRRMRQVVEKDDNPVIRGMLLKVRHLVSVEEIA